MKYIQWISLLIVVAGSFSPLVHIPLIGNWNYWQTDHLLAIFCWIFCVVALLGILFNKNGLVRISAVFMLIFFAFSIFAIKYQSNSFFNFLHFDFLKEAATGLVKLKWGWFLEFFGAFMLLVSNPKK